MEGITYILNKIKLLDSMASPILRYFDSSVGCVIRICMCIRIYKSLYVHCQQWEILSR